MIPNKKELEELNNNLINQKEIAKKYEVSQGTVSNWFNKYKLQSKIKTGGSKGKDLVGQKFGKLTVIKLETIGKYGKEYLCECECGNKKIVLGTQLTRKQTTSCGCIRGKQNINKKHDKFSKSKIGEKHNLLTIIGIEEYKGNSGNYLMTCQCDCGNITKQIYADIKKGKVKSCGCYQKEQASKTGSNVGLNNYKNKYDWYFIKDGKQIKCRSGYEVIYANCLIQNNIQFEYEPECFKLDNGKRYTPDFYLIDEDRYIEIKGNFKIKNNYSHQQENTELFKENHNWEILYWDNIIEKCNLPFKVYSSYLRKARKLSIKEEDYLGKSMYMPVI